jgi:putative iron-dependent peroxidase
MCFELERLTLDALGKAVAVVDEVQGFRYFDSRDLLGFVDGTENPTGVDLTESALIQSEDRVFEGGSRVVVQKYLHKLDKWRALETATQENIIGPTKPDNIELEDTGRESHKTLTTIVDAEGIEHDILRDNMPFGSPGRGEFGTYLSAIREIFESSKKCWRICSKAPPRAATIEFWISRRRRREQHSLRRHIRCSKALVEQRHINRTAKCANC